MNLPRRTYYYKPKHKPSDEALVDRIADICLEFPRYGYRRVTEQLQREGWIINHKKIARIMRENNWSCVPRKKRWIVTTNSNHGLSIYPNLITDLTPITVNQLWVADITYIRTLRCFVYLAVILDAFSKKGDRVRLVKTLRHKARPWRITHGHLLQTPRARLHPPFRPWCPVCLW